MTIQTSLALPVVRYYVVTDNDSADSLNNWFEQEEPELVGVFEEPWFGQANSGQPPEGGLGLFDGMLYYNYFPTGSVIVLPWVMGTLPTIHTAEQFARFYRTDIQSPPAQ
jgi:hypothetical protein